MMDALLGLAVLAVAAANGANDNAKGVATLIGSHGASPGRALAWGTLATLAGGLGAATFGSELAQAFSGKGLLAAGSPAGPVLLVAVGIGATAAVAIAAVGGLPISTTHALLGGLVGAGSAATAGQLAYGALLQRFVAPLLLSPLLAMLLVVIAYETLSRWRRASGLSPTSCLCLTTVVPVALGSDAIALQGGPLPLAVHRCESVGTRAFAGINARQVLIRAHFASAGVQSFARGLNDTPKIAALGLGWSLATGSAGNAPIFVVVALSMAIGGWFGAARVGRTMAHRITDLNDGQALTCNAVTAALVLAASALHLPVSMTHVSVGSLAGLGWSTGQARWGMLRTIGLSWLLTLPLAAAAAAATYLLLERLPQ